MSFSFLWSNICHSICQQLKLIKKYNMKSYQSFFPPENFSFQYTEQTRTPFYDRSSYAGCTTKGIFQTRVWHYHNCTFSFLLSGFETCVRYLDTNPMGWTLELRGISNKGTGAAAQNGALPKNTGRHDLLVWSLFCLYPATSTISKECRGMQ